ncbi:MAG: trypsin-like peptidase domain-containing protein [Actinobacteria bacterium]|nr:trypsin-like peptidase domain-containing protein [Actinomycetota bacterium]
MNPSRSRTSMFLAGLLAALGLGAGGGAVAYAVLSDESTTVVRQVTVNGSEPAATADGLSIGEIYDRSQEAVVEITASATQFSGSQSAQGSGFVFDEGGHIVTNQHVVEGASSISVRFWDGSSRAARLVGTDASTDLAVIDVNAPASFLEPLRLGDSSDVDVGDGVVAMGSPFGLEGTVTSGIVSALHRQMTAPNNFTITDSIQTDAAINHGNSGGPLVDQQGRVIGVNAQIESESGGSDGVGFAIPSDTVRSIVTQIIATGEAEHAYLGVSMLPVPGGAAVTEVHPGAPAEKAGLRPATGTRTVEGQEIPSGGDVIVEFDGDAISTSAELQSAVDAKKPGDVVSLTVLRGGKRRMLDVTLGTRPERVPS